MLQLSTEAFSYAGHYTRRRPRCFLVLGDDWSDSLARWRPENPTSVLTHELCVVSSTIPLRSSCRRKWP